MPKRIAKKLDVFRALVPAHLFKQIVGVVTGIVVDEIKRINRSGIKK